MLLAVIAVGLLAVGISRWTDDDDAETPSSGSLASTVRAAGPAEAPFENLTETTLGVGAKDVRIVLADSEAERERGLRLRSDLGPYGGMLFAFPAPITTNFTMSTVPVALDIGFYDAQGRAVGRLRMEPCAGTELECPVYGIDRPFLYALETLVGALPTGSLETPDPG